ncbi:Na+/H+ dicarboxylate symporter [Pseudomonas sp. GM21]|uniref:C4-dicarboxylate transporter DctA n=1 Tax=Pseudomonas sp. GM21 TaxID=1144325 RepID=UPI0002722F1D|nr:C4-dicarboxylate transporter DctA [Pseudomonas sp. GM21]EJM22309.1 Na+/H+ dicarboxylate symporter [Pseudomonas sp. GM21]
MKSAMLRPLKPLYIQVLIGVILGTLFALFDAKAAVEMKVLGDVFIKLIKMVVAPVVFATVVVGIAKMGDIRSVGRVGAKALIYFEIVTTAALVIGILVAHLMQPGAGMNIDPKTLDMSAVAGYAKIASEQSLREFFLHIIPDTIMSAFVNGEILPVVFLAVLFGVALAQGGKRVSVLVDVIDQTLISLFSIISYLMKFAPIGAFGAIAFTVGKYGISSLATLGYLMMAFYATCFLFIFVVLGLILKLCGVNIFAFLNYLKTELLITLGTASAEPALPGLLQKLEKLGCKKSVVGLVVPTGYAFNLDGVCIYLTMSVIFIAQATNTPLTLSQELTILAIGLFTSKGMSGVPGGGFVALAATLASVHVLPLSAIALLVGIDRFMGEARAVTSIIGNAVAGVVISKWEGALNIERMNQVLRGEYVEPDAEFEAQPVSVQASLGSAKAKGTATNS